MISPPVFLTLPGHRRVSGVKLGWAEGEKPVFLEIGAFSIDQIDRSSGRPVACYTYKDIEAIAKVCILIVFR
ncbi:unnamed protein product [Dibothriocephalus latus]|uniref:DnaJ homologue subfamily C GRV2/DNAJC13 N-terminal domain-containing protein n=1 Tax=Dibothriocephalus latus TaxID=60516 RepID=A0A3P7LPK2_DIBLA|nr:unnamed protein product [Dibothriocephalus latus]